jgi:peptidyl-prolyl cis-trans isomerase A (cyclophilin A)
MCATFRAAMRLVFLFCFAAAFLREANATLVKVDTELGSMTFQLYDDTRPITVTNFLNYVTSGRYDGTFAHRLSLNFVLQGGGYVYDNINVTEVPTDPPILNEAGLEPKYSNVLGTIAMAKLGNSPNSATSQWFINLKDNSANLDIQNGGFTVFGAIVDGMSVLDSFIAFTSQPEQRIVNTGSPFDELPVLNYSSGTLLNDNLIHTTWSVVVPEPAPTQLLGIAAASFFAARRIRNPLRRQQLPSPGGSAPR